MKRATNATLAPLTRTHSLLTSTERHLIEDCLLSGPASVRNALARNGVTDVGRALDARLMRGHAHPAPRCDMTPIETDTDTGEPARGVLVALVIELVVGAAIGLALAGWLAWAAGWIG